MKKPSSVSAIHMTYLQVGWTHQGDLEKSRTNEMIEINNLIYKVCLENKESSNCADNNLVPEPCPLKSCGAHF